MNDRHRLRARSPMRDPARASLQSFNYGTYPELHAIPTRREIVQSPRVSTDRGLASPIVTTTYKISGDSAASSRTSTQQRSDRRERRSTLDTSNRPVLVNPAPRRAVQVGGRPSSPLQNPFRSSDEGDFYSIPASSVKSSRTHKSRPSYSQTFDNSDFDRSKDGAKDRLLRVDSGRSGATYRGSRPRQTQPTSLVRHADTMADDYGVDGYGYTNPRDVVQYDLARSAPRYESRRESYGEPSRSSRPTSIGGVQDLQPRKYDSRGGPPPSNRGFDRIPRQPMYDQQPTVRMPSHERSSNRSDPVWEDRTRQRERPVSLYQESERPRHHDREREEYRDRRDDDIRREPRRSERSDRPYDEDVERRGFGVKNDRNDRNDYEPKRHESRHEHRRDDDRRSERRDDYDDRRDDKKDKKSSGRDTLGTVMGIAGAALGISGLANVANNTRGDSDRESDGREDRRRRKDRDEEPRHRKKDSRDDEYSDRDRRERRERDERDPNKDRRGKEPEAVDLRDRKPQEKPARDSRDFTPPSSREDSPPSQDTTVPRHHRIAQTAAPAFNPKDTMDLRALKEALNRQDGPSAEPVPIPAKSGSKEAHTGAREVAGLAAGAAAAGSFDPRDPKSLRNIQAELRDYEQDDMSTSRRSRNDSAFAPPEIPSRVSSGSTNGSISIVSPPLEAASLATSTAGTPKPTVKGILRPPREKFPEEANPIREGVAPLKDSKKDGIPPDARWTKISRHMVNPEALELGKERYEARDDCVIVLRVLSKEEVQGYAEVTQKIRQNREDEEDRRRRERRRSRHQRHAKERRRNHEKDDDAEGHSSRHHRSSHRDRDHDKSSHSESDTTEDEEDDYVDVRRPKSRGGERAEREDRNRPRGVTFGGDDGGNGGNINVNGNGKGKSFAKEEAVEYGSANTETMGNLKETGNGTYEGYVRNPPPRSEAADKGKGREREK